MSVWDKYECEGQLNLFDIEEQKPTKSAYQIYKEYCIKRGWYRGETEEHPASWMCSFKNRKNATCWEDWIECTEKNCPLLKGEN